MKTSAEISPVYLRLLLKAIAQQVICMILSAFLFEPVRAFRFVVVAMLAQYFAMTLIAIRRPVSPMQGDSWVFQFGFVPLLIITRLLSPLVWKVFGDHTLF